MAANYSVAVKVLVGEKDCPIEKALGKPALNILIL